MTSGHGTRLAVLGSPIAHSLSPRLHAAAYRQLGLDWSYEAIEVTDDSLPGFIDSLGPHWRGLSLTMPLKRRVIELLDEADRLVSLTGVANTVLVEGSRLSGFNTDVAGIVTAFRDNDVVSLDRVAILGGGATAISALVASHELGIATAQLWLRDRSRGAGFGALARELGIGLEIHQFGDSFPRGEAPDAVISTIPNGSTAAFDAPSALRSNSVLFDVAYDPWPTSLAMAWFDAGGRVIPGLEMLINQALVQVRIFVSGDPETALTNEAAVLQAMRLSVRR